VWNGKEQAVAAANELMSAARQFASDFPEREARASGKSIAVPVAIALVGGSTIGLVAYAASRGTKTSTPAKPQNNYATYSTGEP
jgi:hypothetical protein